MKIHLFKVYTEGFSMKSNEKYVFSLIYCPVGALLPKRKILFEHARRLGSCDYFDVIYSTCRLVYNMDEWSIYGKAEYNAIFLGLR